MVLSLALHNFIKDVDIESSEMTLPHKCHQSL